MLPLSNRYWLEIDMRPKRKEVSVSHHKTSLDNHTCSLDHGFLSPQLQSFAVAIASKCQFLWSHFHCLAAPPFTSEPFHTRSSPNPRPRSFTFRSRSHAHSTFHPFVEARGSTYPPRPTVMVEALFRSTCWTFSRAILALEASEEMDAGLL